MDIDTNTAASVQDASLSKKDGIVDEKLLSATETSISANESVPIKESEADCSSTVDNTDLDKINEKDDLLQQIEEVCNDNAPSVKNSEDISKTEHDFFKEIDEMEDKDKLEAEKANENTNEELKAKNILECEAETIDTVVIGNKLLVVKEENHSPTAATSSDDDVDKNTTVERSDICSTSDEPTNKDATVSSSTSKVQNTDSDQCTSEKSTNSLTKTLLEDDEKKKDAAPVADLEEEKNDIEKDKSASIEEVDDTSDKICTDEVSTAKSVESKPEAASDACMIKPSTDVPISAEDSKDASQNASSDTTSNNKLEVVAEGSSTDKVVNAIVKDTMNEIDVLEIKKPENKTILDIKSKESIVSSSLANTPVSSSNVFNSTPIQKQFEISSENVSKISDAAECSHTEKEEATSSKPRFEYSTSESGTCLTIESDQPSSDGTMKKYLNAIKKYNGMPDTTTDEENTSVTPQTQENNDNLEVKGEQVPGNNLKRDSLYEVRICCEENDIRYLSIERLNSNGDKSKTIKEEKMSTSDSSVQSSSNGSVSSLPPYSFPQIIGSIPSESTTSSINCHRLTPTQKKHTIVGIEEVCNFMINHFTTIKKAINPEVVNDLQKGHGVNIISPTQQMKKNKKYNTSVETPTASASKNKRARKRSLQEDDSEITPKSKQQKRDISKEIAKANYSLVAEETEESKIGPCVLAKWVDKKFYAGKITAEKPGNKFVVLFEDGASKTLPKESIVFGEGEILPLQDQHVYASIEDDYECGVVLSIEKSNNKVIYTVKTDSSVVKVTASDIYLEVDQAKEIQKLQNIKVGDSNEEEEAGGSRPSRNKRPPASPSTPEAGFSGTTGKRGGKRQKRYS